MSNKLNYVVFYEVVDGADSAWGQYDTQSQAEKAVRLYGHPDWKIYRVTYEEL